MNELYATIESLIMQSGYTKEITGKTIYNEICDLIEEKESGTYLLMTKHEDGEVFEYNTTILENDFNLSALTITTKSGAQYTINFDNVL